MMLHTEDDHKNASQQNPLDQILQMLATTTYAGSWAKAMWQMSSPVQQRASATTNQTERPEEQVNNSKRHITEVIIK